MMSDLKHSSDEIPNKSSENNRPKVPSEDKWTSDLEGLLRRWKRQVGLRSRGHADQSKKYEQRHYFIGIPASILAAVVATGALTTFFSSLSVSNDCLQPLWIELVLGITSVISTCLTAYQTFIGYQGKAERNKTACDEYESLYRYIDTILSVPASMRGDPYKTLTHTRTKFDEIVKKSDRLPRKYDTFLSFGLEDPKPQRIDIETLLAEEKLSHPRLERVNESNNRKFEHTALPQSLDNVSLYITDRDDVENAVVKNVASIDRALAFEMSRLEEGGIKKSVANVKDGKRAIAEGEGSKSSG